MAVATGRFRRATACVVHVAPDPAGGWLVEAADRRFAPASYATLAQARAEAMLYASSNPGWRVVVHDYSNPVAR